MRFWQVHLRTSDIFAFQKSAPNDNLLLTFQCLATARISIQQQSDACENLQILTNFLRALAGLIIVNSVYISPRLLSSNGVHPTPVFLGTTPATICYLYLYMYIYVYIYIHVCEYIHVCIYIYVCIYICIHIYIYIYVYKYIYIYVYKHIYMHTHIYIDVQIYIYMCIYIYITYTSICKYIFIYVFTYTLVSSELYTYMHICM